jgi:F-type H+-transporting ATPase subunit delta
MKITKQARRDAKTLLRACQVNGLLDEARVRQAVEEVVAAKPRGYVAILQHFHRLVKLDIARRTALVESAVSLSPDMQNSISANLGARHGGGLDLHFVVKPEVIGGLRIQVGSDVYDGSVAARLAELESSF